MGCLGVLCCCAGETVRPIGRALTTVWRSGNRCVRRSVSRSPPPPVVWSSWMSTRRVTAVSCS